jgi:hypothetical protein
MPRRILTPVTVALALAIPTAGPAQQPSAAPLPVEVAAPTCPVCAIAPRTETVRHPAYAAKEEPFCLRRVTCRTFLRRLCGLDCDPPCCEPPRFRTRLVKWEVTETRESLKCVVEHAPVVAPCPPPPLPSGPPAVLPPS